MKKGDYEYMMYSLFSQLTIGPINKTCDSVNNYPSNTPPPKDKKQKQNNNLLITHKI